MEESIVLCTNCSKPVSDNTQGPKIFRQYRKTKKEDENYSYMIQIINYMLTEQCKSLEQTITKIDTISARMDSIEIMLPEFLRQKKNAS